MATDIGGLFTTPDQYELAQQQAQQAQARQYAQLDPRAQAQYGFYRGGQQLAGAIGGALGIEDPQLKTITQRQQLIGMIDPTNPDSFAPAIQMALQTGDTQAAYLLRNGMMEAKKQAQDQQINELKTQDYLVQRGQGMQAQGMTNLANQLIGQIKNPDGSINEEVKAQLLSFPQGRAAISELAKVAPDLRRIGAMGAVEDNPFTQFIQDPTIPANVKTLATQYSTSLAKGILDPEKADAKVKELADMTQRIQQFEQNQAQIKANQEMMAGFRQQGLENTQGFLAIAQANQRLAQQNATINNQLRLEESARKTQAAQDKAEAAKNKPLPANLAKGEEEDYDIATSATNLASDAYSFINRIKSGEIKFGLKDKASIATRSALGSSAPDVLARQDFDKFIQRMTAENLRLNKGVQTDKDFERELNLLKSAESASSAAKIMQNLVNINVRKVQDASSNISRRRANAGFGEPPVSVSIPQFEPHIITDADYSAFLKNPKYPKGSVFVDPQGVRRTKP